MEDNNSSSSNKIMPRRSTRLSIKPNLKTENDFIDENEDEIMQTETERNFFSENPDMHHCGQQIYVFKTPKKNNAMIAKAYNSPSLSLLKTPKTPKMPKTPKTPRTPKITKTPLTPSTPTSSRKLAIEKTPRHIRVQMRKGLRKIREDDDDELEDFELSSDETSESEENSEESSSSSDDESDAIVNAKRDAEQNLQTRRTRMSSKRQQSIIFESDKYFGRSKKKDTTSDNTLNCLKTPRLQNEELFKLLAATNVSDEHQNCLKELYSDYETLFPKWLFSLKEGFSILLYGVGSKRNILQTLHSTILAKEDVLVVNGYFPSFTITEILNSIVNDLLEISCKSRTLHEIVDAIEEEMNETPDYHMYLIIHNLDGVMLRNEMAQDVLSRLAHLPNIHLIASIDHINTLHLWDSIKLSNYNFLWYDVTTFMPYTDEISVVENSVLMKNSGAVTISSMKSVFLSLTRNARGIYLIIVKNQLACNKSSNFQGMPFKHLYKKCIEEFLVSSDVVLRTQLIELCDHNLLKLKRTADGTEQVKIPVDNILLQQFLEQQNYW